VPEQISFSCPRCKHPLTAAAADRGRLTRCVECEAIITIPQFGGREQAGGTVTFAEPAAAGPAVSPTSSPATAVDVARPAPLPLRRTSLAQDDEIDMTPMIDVVFQLLIFFMVTAAFALQKTLPVPTPESQSAVAAAPVELDDADLVTVRVEADDSLWVDDVLAVSRQDLIAKLRRLRTTSGLRGGPGPRRLRVVADPDAKQEFVVTALDAGSAAGMEEIQLAAVDDAL
jgi:biopolymer transport protein ExbD